jgi:hypothetical protein
MPMALIAKCTNCFGCGTVWSRTIKTDKPPAKKYSWTSYKCPVCKGTCKVEVKVSV